MHLLSATHKWWRRQLPIRLTRARWHAWRRRRKHGAFSFFALLLSCSIMVSANELKELKSMVAAKDAALAVLKPLVPKTIQAEAARRESTFSCASSDRLCDAEAAAVGHDRGHCCEFGGSSSFRN